MSWYYATEGRQSGPVEDGIFEDLVRQGVVGRDTLVWKEGMASWVPYGQLAASPVMAPATSPQQGMPVHGAPVAAGGGETRYCTQCGRSYPVAQLEAFGAATVCASCKPAYLASQQTAGQLAAGGYPGAYAGQPAPGAVAGRRYAGFWIRFLARIIDGILIFIAQMIIQVPLGFVLRAGANAGDPASVMAAMGVAGLGTLVGIALGVFYEAYFLSTRGATPGKLALGLQVIRADNGEWLSTGQAVGRYFAQWLSGITLMIGYIIAGFDTEKRALHDHICGTRVIYNP